MAVVDLDVDQEIEVAIVELVEVDHEATAATGSSVALDQSRTFVGGLSMDRYG